MTKNVFLAISILSLTACSQGVTTIADKSSSPCGEKPNCVSTLDNRDEFNIAPFELTPDATLEMLEQAALQLPGAKTAVKEKDYLRIECTSTILRFVDDLELKIEGQQLIVRSESRTGYSDFGVNRKRAEQLRAELIKQNLIMK
ncbi:DUF1499 domain-containing protein [Vibrio sp. Of7-15]|uniref:DUF1499 domain-containing protein n=1 Tax=Vibrio sp. Of7-15 TaxID=2724879 RepID=UPI001EF38BCD|nr:DUF1499 domain-containing protein [Vibrio sp. Of7-15]MCG7497626.1 DUF1499 domain-containing protein [Vibrio sp. Of7-15]